MKYAVIMFLAACCCSNLSGNSNFVNNPLTPYPPGCATTPSMQTLLYGDNLAKFYEGYISFTGVYGDQSDPLAVSAYRVGCAEPNRSVIWLTIRIPGNVNLGGNTMLRLPVVAADLGGDILRYMSLVSEPNSWGVGSNDGANWPLFGDGTSGWDDAHRFTWIYVLDNAPSSSSALTPAEYNGSFDLWVDYGGFEYAVIPVPSTASVLEPNPRIPLNGRLSGNWVTEGASDQGFLVSISSLAESSDAADIMADDAPLLMYLSWYTYDAKGKMMWLTGAARFPKGASEVVVPIELVTNGQFLGAKPADREVVGSVTITGNNCNDLGFEYDLTDIGLGSGTKHLERLFSLETAGYTCRDLEARIAENAK